MKFNISHADQSEFSYDGLRQYFEYRDLGIKEATDGKAVMHVIRAREGTNATGEWHYHNLQLQIVYVLKGWAIFEYEGHGQHKIVAGSCVHQPPGIRHREIAHSDDLELLEIVLPGEFETISLGQ
ncbi:cupin domain-containing protein [Orrella daihaiensis]|uniref:Cupin domain-containing protein n=1 Tax=Orrella daihaiensis TaxID=2782176 RepID=A0ABY4AHF1_9BURK|nr:cupin domain-containing protein [Orrella daihaiensis]UOD49614.1 cupin domain-containing protein [Orrella daihaiensis]